MKRLTDEGGDDFGSELLRSAKKDAPRANVVARATGAAAAKASTLGMPAWLKLAGLGTVVATIAAIVALVATRPATHEAPTPTNSVSVAMSSVARDDASVEQLASSGATVATASEAAPLLPPPPAVSRVAASPDDLPRELAALDRARTAMTAKDGPRAVKELGDYFRDFPHGALREEAEATQVQALVVSGQRDSAEKAGRAFLLAHPASPHAKRVRTLLQSLSDAGP